MQYLKQKRGGGVRSSPWHLQNQWPWKLSILNLLRSSPWHLRSNSSCAIDIQNFSLVNRERGHYDKGLFTGGISSISTWSDSPVLHTVWGFSGNSLLRRPLFQKTPFPNPNFEIFAAFPWMIKHVASFEEHIIYALERSVFGWNVTCQVGVGTLGLCWGKAYHETTIWSVFRNIFKEALLPYTVA